MKTLRFLNTAKTIGYMLLLTSCALSTHATDWIITGTRTGAVGGVGGWLGPVWGVTGSYASLQSGDTFIFTTDVWTSVANTFNPAANTKSLNFTSDNDQWRTIGNTANVGASRILLLQQGNHTYNFNNIIIASGTTTGNGSFGAGISFTTGASGTNTITGNLILQNNSVIGSSGQNFGGAINLNTLPNSYLAISATIVFRENVAISTAPAGSAAQGGAINIAGNALGAEFTGVALFESNTTSSALNTAGNGGAYFAAASGTSISIFSNRNTFKNNYASGGGGAIATTRSQAQAPGLVISGYSYFEGNQSAATAIGGGGAIFWTGDLSISGSSTFISNTTGYYGGAIFLSNPNTHSLSLSLDASDGNITFINNQHMAGSAAAERNAIVIETSSTQTIVPVVTLNSGATAGDHAIYFFDPVSVTDTTAAALVNVTGSNAVVFDTFTSAITGTTRVQSGAMALTRGAVYGSGTDYGDFIVETGAKLSANGAVRANTITLADGAQLEVNGGGSITLAATTLNTGTSLVLSGHGTIDIAKALDVARIDVGTLISGDPTVSAYSANHAQILTLGSSMPVSLADGGTISIDLFADGSSDLLHIDTTTFSLSGSVGYINLVGVGNDAYKVITAATDLTSITDDLKPLVNGNAPTGHFGAIKDYRAGNTELWIMFSTINLFTTWTGTAAEGAIWQGAAGGPLNWDNKDSASPDYTFLNGDAVLFDDTATAKTVTIHDDGVRVADMTVDNTAGNDYTFAGAGGITASTTISLGSEVTPAGKLTKTGDGSLNFANTGANTFEDGIEISGGTLGFTAAAQLGDGGNGIRFMADATLRANANNLTLANTLKIDAGKTAAIDTAANTLAYSGLLDADTTGTLAKVGAGALKITADNSSNTASTHVREGALALDGANAKLGGRIDIDGGATLAGAGAATGDVYAAAGAIIHPGALDSATPATLNINNLSVDSSILRFNLFASGTNDRILVTNPITANGASTIDISTFQSGTFNLGSLAGLNIPGTAITIGGYAMGTGARQSGTLATSGADLLLIAAADMSRILRWAGATSGTWSPVGSNWTDGAAVNLFAGGDRVIFDDTAPAASPRDITIAVPGVHVSDMFVQGTGNYSFSGAGITADPASVITGTVITTGTGKLVKGGSGTLAFNNAANNFLGGIDIDGGAITFTDATQLGTGTNAITFTGDATLVSLSAAQTLAGDITIADGKTAAVDTQANSLGLSGSLAVAGTTGTLLKIGTGTLALGNGATTAAGLSARVNEGALLLANAHFAGSIDVNSNAALIASGTVASARIADDAALLLNDNSLNIADLQLAENSSIGGFGTLEGIATLNGTVYARVASSTTRNLTITGTVNGAGGFLKTGEGKLVLSGTAALGSTGVMQLDAGVVQINDIQKVSNTTINYNTDYTIHDSGSTIVIPDRTFTLTGTSIFVPGGTFSITGSTFVISSTTGACPNFVVTTSTITTGRFIVPATGTVNIPGITTVLPSCTVTVGGVTTVYGSNTFVIPEGTFSMPEVTVTSTFNFSDSTSKLTGANTVYTGYNTAFSVAQNVLLNGGTLALTGAGALNEANANNWRGVRFIQGDNAATSAIYGTSDLIYLGPGTFAPALRDGLLVAIEAGNSTAVLNNLTNTFTGLVRIDSGTLQVFDARQLGSSGTITTPKLVLNGGDLHMSGNYETSRPIEMRANGSITVDEGFNATWGAINKPAAYATADFVKLGSGTLTIKGANAATNLTIDEGHYVTTSAAGIGAGAVTVAGGAAIEFNAVAAGSATTGFIGSTRYNTLPQAVTVENAILNPLTCDIGTITGTTATSATTAMADYVSWGTGYVAGKPFAPAGTINRQITGSGTLMVTNGQWLFTHAQTDIPNIVVTGSNSAFGVGAQVNFSPSSTMTVDQGATLVLASPEQTLGNVVLSNKSQVSFLMNAATYPTNSQPYTFTRSGTACVSGSLVVTSTLITNYRDVVRTWGGGFKKANFESLSGEGVLHFNTCLQYNASDHLTVNTPVSGTFAIGIINYGQAPELYLKQFELISAPESPDATFLTPEKIDIGLYSYDIKTANTAGGLSITISGTGGMSNVASLVNTMAGALPLSWFAELQSVTQRMGELHLETRSEKAGLSAWVRTYGQSLEFNDKATGTPFDERQLAAEGGADYKFGGTPYNIYIGGFFGYGQTDRDYDITGDGSTESVFGGLYGTISTPNGWYVDLVGKVNGFKNEFDAVWPSGETMTASYDNWAVGGSLEIGKYWDIGYDWYVIPQIQGACAIIVPQDYTTSNGMQVSLRYSTTAQARIGFILGRTIEVGAHGALNIYVKGYGASQWTTNGQIYVIAASGQSKRYTPTIKGDRMEAGGGIAWRATERTQYYFDFETAAADYYKKPWGVNFGIRHSW